MSLPYGILRCLYIPVLGCCSALGAWEALRARGGAGARGLSVAIAKQKSAWRPPRCTGACSRVLSVSESTIRLGQDRLSDVLESGTVRVSGILLPQRIPDQQTKCHFHEHIP
jgi:hypothetical protein